MAASFLHLPLPVGELAPLYAAFPTVAAVELEPVLNQLPFSKQVQLRDGKRYPVQLISEDTEVLVTTGVAMLLPGRVYFAEPVER